MSGDVRAGRSGSLDVPGDLRDVCVRSTGEERTVQFAMVSSRFSAH
jgi:hypothetical protein